MTTFNGFDDFGRRAPGMLERAVRVVGREVQDRALTVADDTMQGLNPPRSTREHRHFGDAWFWAKDGRKVGGRPRAGESKITRGNDAPHALILDLGRTFTKEGRRIGTKAAPRGYSKPALLAVRAAKDQIIRDAIAEANRLL